MRKEVLYAIIFGVILGGIILFGINLANNSVTNLPPESNPPLVTQPTPSVTKNTFEIISPQNHAVITEKTITLTGKATPNTSIAITSELDDLILEVSSEGNFSAEINLLAGENTLTVSNLVKDSLIETESITVIQSSTLPE